MENATKAFMMAAGVLIGVLILSIAVYLFTIFSRNSEQVYKEMESNQVTQFNNQFLKYYGLISRTYIDEQTGKEKTVQEPIKCTVHDIISLANLAYQNNVENQVANETGWNDSTSYIQIRIGNTKKNKNLEKWTEEQKIEFIKDNTNNSYKCVEVHISDITKRICYMKFSKY